MNEIYISRYRLVEDAKSHYVYTVEVVNDGEHHSIEKRYSAFHALHRELRKNFTTPTFPPKRVRCSQPKVLEQRRQGLERYLQMMMKFGPSRTQVMAFLGISPTTNRMGPKSVDHQPVFRVVMALEPRRSNLPDIITDGVVAAIYNTK